MARGSRPEKVQEWTHRIKRFEASSLTVAQFCKAEGVAPQSYYHWKRKLGEAAAARWPGSRFQAVRVSPAGRLPSGPTTIRLAKESILNWATTYLSRSRLCNKCLTWSSGLTATPPRTERRPSDADVFVSAADLRLHAGRRYAKGIRRLVRHHPRRVPSRSYRRKFVSVHRAPWRLTV